MLKKEGTENHPFLNNSEKGADLWPFMVCRCLHCAGGFWERKAQYLIEGLITLAL